MKQPIFHFIFFLIDLIIKIGEITRFLLTKIALMPMNFFLMLFSQLEMLTSLFSDGIKKVWRYGRQLRFIRPIKKKKTRKLKKKKKKYLDIKLVLSVFHFPDLSLFKKVYANINKLRSALHKTIIFFTRVSLPSFHFISVRIKFIIIGCALTIAIIFFQQSYVFIKSLPSPTNIGKVNYPLSTHIYDRNGQLLYEIFRDQNRTPITLKDLPSYVYQATIAVEDKDFYRHQGVSLTSGVLRAMREIVFNRSFQG
ncbi:MAG: transglycosylase domain-containing protein, partial [bacterium]|nr:transglycosylase domain-containing protein [bacterium]